MMRLALAAGFLVACGGDVTTRDAPVEPPASVAQALADGLSVAEVTAGSGAPARSVTLDTGAAVTVQAWSVTVVRSRQPASARALASTASVNLHLAVTRYDAGGSASGVLRNAFDGRAARASFAAGRRLLVTVRDDELSPGAWRVWDAFAVAADGTLAEPALGFPRGAPVEQVLAMP